MKIGTSNSYDTQRIKSFHSTRKDDCLEGRIDTLGPPGCSRTGGTGGTGGSPGRCCPGGPAGGGGRGKKGLFL